LPSWSSRILNKSTKAFSYNKWHFLRLVDVLLELLIKSRQSLIHVVNHLIHDGREVFHWFIEHFLLFFCGVVKDLKHFRVLFLDGLIEFRELILNDRAGLTLGNGVRCSSITN
jgi:hypothetical protein